MEVKKKRRFVVCGILIIVLLVMMTLGGVFSGAWLKDTSTSQDNIIQAGTLDLVVDGKNSVTLPAKLSTNNLKPGDWINVGSATIKNAGTVAGTLTIAVKNISNLENGIIQPEAAAGDESADIGELGAQIGLIPQENVSPWTSYSAMSGLTDGATLSSVGRVLQPGESIQIVFYTTYPSGADNNKAQGDSVKFDLEFTLDQVH